MIITSSTFKLWKIKGSYKSDIVLQTCSNTHGFKESLDERSSKNIVLGLGIQYEKFGKGTWNEKVHYLEI